MRLGLAISVVTVVLGVTTVVAQTTAGIVNGAVSLIGDDGSFAGLASFARIEVVVDEMRGEFKADEVGQFNAQLPVGRYTLVGVVGCRGESLALDGMQVRTFEVSTKKATHFDVMVRAPKGPYQCAAQPK